MMHENDNYTSVGVNILLVRREFSLMMIFGMQEKTVALDS